MPSNRKPHYTIKPIISPTPAAAHAGERNRNDARSARNESNAFLRPPTEDDDGYDPFSDRPSAPEPTFQEDPWR